MSERVRLEVTDGIAYVTLDRADKLNGLDLQMLDDLVATARKVGRDRAIRAVILQGAGDAFSAGLDFATVGKQPAKAARAAIKFPGQSLNQFQRACWVWRKLPVPVVAVTHGRCYGGGLQLALAADFRFSTPDCEFSIMEGKWGMIPDMTGSVTLRELIGMDQAKRLTMTAETFDGVRAKELGLVTEISDQPLRDAEALIAQIVTRSPDSVAATKQLLHKTWNKSPRRAFWIETWLQLGLLRGANTKIARTANFKKEAPQFRKRK